MANSIFSSIYILDLLTFSWTKGPMPHPIGTALAMFVPQMETASLCGEVKANHSPLQWLFMGGSSHRRLCERVYYCTKIILICQAADDIQYPHGTMGSRLCHFGSTPYPYHCHCCGPTSTNNPSTPTPTGPASKSSSSTSGGAIGGAIGGVVILAIIGIFFL